MTGGSSIACNCVHIRLGGPLQHCRGLHSPFILQGEVQLGPLLLQATEQGEQLCSSSVPASSGLGRGPTRSPPWPGSMTVLVAHGGGAVGWVLPGAGLSTPT